MYFYYGIKHSSLDENNPDNNEDVIIGSGMAGTIELTVTDHTRQEKTQHTALDRSIYESEQLDAFGQPVFGSTNFGGTPSTYNQSRKKTPAVQSQQSQDLFVPQECFPTWDD